MRLIVIALTAALIAGCATAPMPAQQEALASIAIAAAIERSSDPAKTAKIVLDIAAMPLSVEAVAPEVKARIGYAKLPASQQLAIDAILADLATQYNQALTTADKDATLALWRRAALAAATRFLEEHHAP